MLRYMVILLLAQGILSRRDEVDTYLKAIKRRITQDGYPFEEHSIETKDGYILGVHRISYSPVSGRSTKKPPVFIQHGLLSSSNDWIVSGPGKGLAYILADAGYDVWMGNARGNTFSRKHKTLSPKDKRFWAFSWDEIGYYDLPAMIDYVLKKTGRTSLNYIGYSQGTTSFFVMTSLRPEYNKKIKSMHALAPVAFMSNVINPFLRVLAPRISKMSYLQSILGNFEFMPSSKFMALAGAALCRQTSVFKVLCKNALFLIGGFNPDNLNASLIPEIVKGAPAGASINQIIHYAQSVVSGHFRRYDFGTSKNKARYGRSDPPDYPLRKITVPVHLYYGNNDWLTSKKDVQILASKLPNVPYNKMVPNPKFNHLDFMWATNIYNLVYGDLINNLKAYT